jgi:hypothetical protein
VVEEWIEDLQESLLHDAVGYNGNPEGPKNGWVRRLRDIDTPHGLGLETALHELALDLA